LSAFSRQLDKSVYFLNQLRQSIFMIRTSRPIITVLLGFNTKLRLSFNVLSATIQLANSFSQKQ